MLDADANASRAVFSMSHVSVVVERVVQLLLHQRALSSLNIGALSLFFWPDITLWHHLQYCSGQMKLNFLEHSYFVDACKPLKVLYL